MENKIDSKSILLYLALLLIGGGIGYFLSNLGNPSAAESDHQHKAAAEATEYTCSMHPQIRQPEPGDCPICGMDLIPVGSEGGGASEIEIKMSPTAMQLASVQTAVVAKQTPTKSLKLTGKVQIDERNIHSQSSHIAGRVEELFVNTTGEYVKKGQIIASIYSPELVTAQKELFEAKKMQETHPQLFEAAKEKLKSWKLTPQQIDDILEGGKPQEQFPIRSDYSGIVMGKRLNLGDYIKQGAPLYEVSELSTVWVLFDIYESDMPWVKVGSEIEFSIQSFPGREFQGRVSFIDPLINPKTRVAKARVVLSNPNGELKPEMFATGQLYSPLKASKKAIAIPKSAVMWTGKKSVVYTKTSDDTGVGFSMKEVVTGASLGDSILILKGLKEGEEIAVYGTFSIDAAAQLAGKPSMMNPKENKDSDGRAIEEIEISERAKKSLQPIYESYLSLKETLANDNFEEAIKKAKSYQQQLRQIQRSLFKNDAHEAWMELQSNLGSGIQKLIDAPDIKGARKEFLTFSEQMIRLTKSFSPYPETLFLQHCPMADNNAGGNWLSTENEIKNPYFGASMLKCGEVREELY